MNKMYEEILPVEVLTPTTVATTANQDSRRIGFNGFRKILINVTIQAADRDAWIDDEALTVALHRASALTGGTTAAMRSAVIVGGVDVLEAEIWTQNHADGDEVTVNGVTFARTTAGYAVARPLEWNDVAQLIANINRECSGITAGSAAGTHGVPLTVDNPGTTTLNVDVDIANPTGQLATLKASALFEAYAAELPATHQIVYVNVNNNHATARLTGNVSAYALAVKGSPYHSPVKHVAHTA